MAHIGNKTALCVICFNELRRLLLFKFTHPESTVINNAKTITVLTDFFIFAIATFSPRFLLY